MRLVVPYVCRGAAALCSLSRWVVQSKTGDGLTVVAGELNRRSGVAPILLFPGVPEELLAPGGLDGDADPPPDPEGPGLPIEWREGSGVAVADEALASRWQAALSDLQDAHWLALIRGEAAGRCGGPLARSLALAPHEGGGPTPAGVLLHGRRSDLAAAAHRARHEGALTGCWPRLPRARWGELALPKATSWDALEAQIACLVEQAVMEASPPPAAKKSPRRRVPKALKRATTELAGSSGRSEAGLGETRTEATDSTRDDQEDVDLSDGSVVKDLAGEGVFSEGSDASASDPDGEPGDACAAATHEASCAGKGESREDYEAVAAMSCVPGCFVAPPGLLPPAWMCPVAGAAPGMPAHGSAPAGVGRLVFFERTLA